MKNLKSVNEFFNFKNKNGKKSDKILTLIDSSLLDLRNLPIVHDYKVTKLNDDYKADSEKTNVDEFIIRFFLNADDGFGDGATTMYVLSGDESNGYKVFSFSDNSVEDFITVSEIETKLPDMLKDSLERTHGGAIEEDGSGGGGAAVATAGTTAGMGNVTSAQPASTPGAAATGDGTTGSGDYGNPLFPTAKQDGSNTVGKKKKRNKDKDKNKRKNKKESAIQDFISRYKAGKTKGGKTTSSDGTTSSKMMSFNDFVNNDIKK